MIHKIQHKKQDSVIVPLVAIEKNIIFLRNGGKVEFSCGAIGIAKDIEEIHILSESANKLIKSVYGSSYNNISILKRWFSNFGEHLMSLTFVYFKIKIEE